MREMKTYLSSACILALCAGSAIAGGIDRSGQSIGAIFEKGDYVELSFGSISPNVSGTAVALAGGATSGDMTGDYFQLGMAVKTNLTDNIDVALIFDQPFGANVDYPAGTGYYAQGTTAELKTTALTFVGKYTLPSNVSFLAGLRYQTFAAEASVPFVAGYSALGEQDGGVGYLVGVAYEKPEIALRIALTYNSEIKHSLDTSENSLLGASVGTTPITTPKSVNLEFQSGIAKDTLLFGSIRWVDWSSFIIDPPAYPPTTPLVSYNGDYTTYTLGVGRKFSENWSAAVTLGYEKPIGGFSSNLGPADGQKSIGIGATYTKDNIKITGGVRYVEIGDAQPQLPGLAPSANFTDNSALGFGLKISYSF
jgi:long-chain fatty acid transport protein